MYSCGNACVAFSGDGNIQEKICVNTRRKPCERCEKSADHEHGTFLSLKHWKGYYSKNRRSFFSDSLKHQNCIAIVVKRNFLLKSWAGNESAGIFIYLSIHLFNDTPRVETDPPVVLVQFPCCSVPANPNGVSAKAVPCLLLKSKIDGSDRRVSPPHNFNKFHGVNNDAAPGCLIARGTI